MIVVSYIRTWPMDDGKFWQADEIHGELIDVLNIAFASIQENMVLLPDFPCLIEQVEILKKNFSHLKVKLSVGGMGADGFSDMANSKQNRSVFIESVTDLLKNSPFDGIDIDWEYPVKSPAHAKIKTRDSDASNYIILLQELKAALIRTGETNGKYYSLSAAVSAEKWFPELINISALQNELDYLKIMNYDYYSFNSPITGHASNLFESKESPSLFHRWSNDQAIQAYINAGAKPEKLIMGIPFYGRGWTGVKNERNGLFQEYRDAFNTAGISFSEIQNILKRDKSFSRFHDAHAAAAWLYNGDIFISYDDEKSVALKKEYARKNGLAGLMVWEYCHDMDGKLFSILKQ